MAQDIFQMSEQYEEYLIDESKFTGSADSISFPESEEEMIDILNTLMAEGTVVTVQGGKTGIVGGAVPKGGHIMNLSHMSKILDASVNDDGTGSITVQPGINLMDLRKAIRNHFRKEELFWPPDPTETSASIGGIVASGAQGTSRLLYGSSKKYIEKLRVLDTQGNVSEINRTSKIELSDGRQIDQIDTVFGKEGITGIISELTLRLVKKPEEEWVIAFFFEQENDAAEFIDGLKEELPQADKASIASVEFIDRNSIDLIEARKATMTKIKELPDIREEIMAMVYIEIHGSEVGVEEIAEMLMEAAIEHGSDPDEAWAVSSETDVEKLHAFRHGAAETTNLFIEESHQNDKRITKLGTDMVIGERTFSQVLDRYKESIQEAGLKGCIFGHALENHLHVNLLPENYEDYLKGKQLIRKWAEEADTEDSQIIGEHGIGKLKQEILEDAISKSYINLCKELKKKMDKDGRLNQGNIFQ